MDNLCYELPEKFLERLKKLYSDEEYRQVLNAFSNKPLPTFRVNRIKIQKEDLEKKLQNEGFEIEAVPWYNDAFILKNKSIRELTETEPYKNGEVYIQNLSSMIPVLILDPKPGEKILDLAAAPGSKTTQIAAMMDNHGLLVANDASRTRLYKMESILKQCGIHFQRTSNNQISDATDSLSPLNTLIINSRGESLWKRYIEYFDKTLIDVPCTMEGRIQCNDPKTYDDWSTKKIKQLSMLQKYLLRSAISATKPGGTIVYSTCTLAPEENEEVIDWVLKKSGDSIELENISISGLSLKPGIPSWNKFFNEQVAKSSRIIPSIEMEGFFVAKIKKLKSNFI